MQEGLIAFGTCGKKLLLSTKQSFCKKNANDMLPATNPRNSQLQICQEEFNHYYFCGLRVGAGSRPSCSAHRKDFAVHHWALPTCPSQELRKQKRSRRPAGMVHAGLKYNSRNTRDENRTPAIIDLVTLNEYRVDCLLQEQISNCTGVIALLLLRPQQSTRGSPTKTEKASSSKEGLRGACCPDLQTPS
jgi:hypothetical protein